MQDAIKPRDANDVAEAIASAAANEKRLELIGRGSKREIGRATQTDMTLDLSAISGITLYEPEELVLSARAATPVSEIEKALEASQQELAFEPMDYGPLLNKTPGEGTIGGAIAAGLSGPRRIKAGAARDFMLGVAAVSGRGEIFKAGGRVVKNVTGYDLPRMLAGSWGTLAAMTDITLKVLPRAEDCATVLVFGLTIFAPTKRCRRRWVRRVKCRLPRIFRNGRRITSPNSHRRVRQSPRFASKAFRSRFRIARRNSKNRCVRSANSGAWMLRSREPSGKTSGTSRLSPIAPSVRSGRFRQRLRLHPELRRASTPRSVLSIITTGQAACYGWRCPAINRRKARCARHLPAAATRH